MPPIFLFFFLFSVNFELIVHVRRILPRCCCIAAASVSASGVRSDERRGGRREVVGDDTALLVAAERVPTEEGVGAFEGLLDLFGQLGRGLVPIRKKKKEKRKKY